MDKYRALELFIATVDRGSFAAAARQFATDPSTVSKAIKRLESQLGLRLFQRSTRELRLTPVGSQYADTVRCLISQLSDCEDELKIDNESPGGLLRVNLPVSYGRLYMLPIICEFQQQYSNIQLDISFDDAHVDMISQSIDVSVRSGRLNDSRLVAQRLSPIDFVICAAPEYVKKITLPLTENDFPLHRWIRFRFKQTGKLLPIFSSALLYNGEAASGDKGSQDVIVDDGEAMAQCCAAGLGLTQLPHFIARSWVESGKLVTVSKAYRSEDQDVFIIYPQREFLPVRTRRFVDYIKDRLTRMGETPSQTWANKIFSSGN
ncbi:MAG: LysR family transcriptional regulator [Ectothiorhodospiraceae bacterium]|nr:LysR family transcriptional regulator [Ectothiorhodospiraceae bacterium]MBN4052986.1 LysR family transcriptional regulator [Gammaproteobacteria bacterium AH-315-K14]